MGVKHLSEPPSLAGRGPTRAVLFNDTTVDRHHGSSTAIEAIRQLAEQVGIEIIATAPAHADWRSDQAVVGALDCADLLLVNGEGTLHHDRAAGTALLAVADEARRRGMASALVNATWQANGPGFADAARRFDLVAVRESASQRELAALGITAMRVPDLALHHRPIVGEVRSGVGYGDSVVGPVALDLHRQAWKLGAVSLPIMRVRRDPVTAARWLRRFVASPVDLADPWRLFAAVRATFQDLLFQISDRDEFTRRLGALRLVVTGRFHMLMFCLAARTPMLVLASNTFKNEATLADAGLESWRLISSVEAIDTNLLERASQWHGEEAPNVDRFVAAARSAQESLFSELAMLARNARSNREPSRLCTDPAPIS